MVAAVSLRNRILAHCGKNHSEIEEEPFIISCLTMLYVSYNIIHVIRTFSNALAEDLFNDKMSRAVRQFPAELRSNARRKLQMIDDTETLSVLAALPGNRFEKLKGDRKGHYSIRINNQWRVVFQWQDGNALDVSIEDYH